MNKEFYDKYINISEEEMIKGNIYAECCRMDKEDVYAWVYQDELKIKKQKEVVDKTIEKINDYKIYCKENKGFTEYTDIEIEAIEPVISKLEDILKEVSE